jgi:hypothetical protein
MVKMFLAGVGQPHAKLPAASYELYPLFFCL